MHRLAVRAILQRRADISLPRKSIGLQTVHRTPQLDDEPGSSSARTLVTHTEVAW
jgi:hypothetical protein